MSFIKEYSGWDSACDISSNTTEYEHPNNWVIYKYVDKYENKNTYTLCLDYMAVNSRGCISMLSHFEIVSKDDNIIRNVSNDGLDCEIITEKYNYKFTRSLTCRTIKNSLDGFYNAPRIVLDSIVNRNRTIENAENPEKYHLNLDGNILNLYIDGEYAWSKIISLKYTEGTYFMLRDKVVTVINNGCGRLDVFNLDGSKYKTIYTEAEYIERADIICNGKFLILYGFVRNPTYVKEIILVDSIFEDRVKQGGKHIVYYEGDSDYDISDSDINETDFVEREFDESETRRIVKTNEVDE